MNPQEVILSPPIKPHLKPLTVSPPIDQDLFQLQHSLSALSLTEPPENYHQDVQRKFTDEDTLQELTDFQVQNSALKRSHRAIHQYITKHRSILVRLQRLQRIPVKKRHY